MEYKWTLDTNDGAQIYGVKNSTNNNASYAIFMIHGLMCNMYEYAFKRAADRFEDKFDVYRFNLHDGKENARTLVDCSLTTHVNDLNIVLSKFSKDYEKVFLIGHSYGGVTVMLANPENITATSLWDPSFDLTRTQTFFTKKHVEGTNLYSLNRGISQLIGEAMFSQVGNLDSDACKTLSANFKSPIQVITAGQAMYCNDAQSFHSNCLHASTQKIISGADHYFREGKSCDELLDETEKWFESFC